MFVSGDGKGELLCVEPLGAPRRIVSLVARARAGIPVPAVYRQKVMSISLWAFDRGSLVHINNCVPPDLVTNRVFPGRLALL